MVSLHTSCVYRVRCLGPRSVQRKVQKIYEVPMSVHVTAILMEKNSMVIQVEKTLPQSTVDSWRLLGVRSETFPTTHMPQWHVISPIKSSHGWPHTRPHACHHKEAGLG